jgi:hypothetical protein
MDKYKHGKRGKQTMAPLTDCLAASIFGIVIASSLQSFRRLLPRFDECDFFDQSILQCRPIHARPIAKRIIMIRERCGDPGGT